LGALQSSTFWGGLFGPPIIVGLGIGGDKGFPSAGSFFNTRKGGAILVQQIFLQERGESGGYNFVTVCGEKRRLYTQVFSPLLKGKTVCFREKVFSHKMGVSITEKRWVAPGFQRKEGFSLKKVCAKKKALGFRNGFLAPGRKVGQVSKFG